MALSPTMAPASKSFRPKPMFVIRKTYSISKPIGSTPWSRMALMAAALQAGMELSKGDNFT